METQPTNQSKVKTRKEIYDEYMKSDHWRFLKRRLFNCLGQTCEVCGHAGTVWHVDAHHLIYRNPLEKCTIRDLMPLCRRCHDIAHDCRIPDTIPLDASEYERRALTWNGIAAQLESRPPIGRLLRAKNILYLEATELNDKEEPQKFKKKRKSVHPNNHHVPKKRRHSVPLNTVVLREVKKPHRRWQDYKNV